MWSFIVYKRIEINKTTFWSVMCLQFAARILSCLLGQSCNLEKVSSISAELNDAPTDFHQTYRQFISAESGYRLKRRFFGLFNLLLIFFLFLKLNFYFIYLIKYCTFTPILKLSTSGEKLFISFFVF